MNSLAPNNLIIRRQIWLVLSELYLDTELDNTDFDRIISALKQTKLSLAAIKNIDLYEVFPLLQTNLLSVAGEWAGFDQEWLYENCEKNYTKSHKSSMYRTRVKLYNYFFVWMRNDYWLQIEKKWTI